MLRNPVISTICIGLLAGSYTANAATLIEKHDPEEGHQQIYVQGKKLRVSMGNGNEYVIIDFANKRAYLVDPDKKEVADASEFITKAPGQTGRLKIGISHIGKGPVIAGYKTEKYRLSVNGRNCSQVMISKKALNDTRIGPLMELMSKVNFDPTGGQFMDECQKADGMFAKRLKTMGMPLGTIEQGQLRDKVRRIVTNASLPKGGFKVPKGYRKISMQQKMQQLHGAGMPPGGMPPGMEGMTPEQMQQFEQMMRQQGY